MDRRSQTRPAMTPCPLHATLPIVTAAKVVRGQNLGLCFALLFVFSCANPPTSEAGPQSPSAQPQNEPTPGKKLIPEHRCDSARKSPKPSLQAIDSPSKPASTEVRPGAWPSELPWMPGHHPDLTSAQASKAGDHVLDMYTSDSISLTAQVSVSAPHTTASAPAIIAPSPTALPSSCPPRLQAQARPAAADDRSLARGRVPDLR